MAVDTKTTAGGVVLFALSGSGSYLATNAISERESTTPSLVQEDRSGSTDSRAPSTVENGNDEGTVTPEEENAASAPQSSTEGNRSAGETQLEGSAQNQRGQNEVVANSGSNTETVQSSPTQTQPAAPITTATVDNGATVNAQELQTTIQNRDVGSESTATSGRDSSVTPITSETGETQTKVISGDSRTESETTSSSATVGTGEVSQSSTVTSLGTSETQSQTEAGASTSSEEQVSQPDSQASSTLSLGTGN